MADEDKTMTFTPIGQAAASARDNSNFLSSTSNDGRSGWSQAKDFLDSNWLTSMASYMLPGIGTARTADDAITNFSNGNIGAGAIDTLFTIMSLIPGAGALAGVAKGGKGIGGVLKGLKAGGKAADAAADAASGIARDGSWAGRWLSDVKAADELRSQRAALVRDGLGDAEKALADARFAGQDAAANVAREQAAYDRAVADVARQNRMGQKTANAERVKQAEDILGGAGIDWTLKGNAPAGYTAASYLDDLMNPMSRFGISNEQSAIETLLRKNGATIGKSGRWQPPKQAAKATSARAATPAAIPTATPAARFTAGSGIPNVQVASRTAAPAASAAPAGFTVPGQPYVFQGNPLTGSATTYGSIEELIARLEQLGRESDAIKKGDRLTSSFKPATASSSKLDNARQALDEATKAITERQRALDAKTLERDKKLDEIAQDLAEITGRSGNRSAAEVEKILSILSSASSGIGTVNPWLRGIIGQGAISPYALAASQQQ